jgi:hypothetical protein
MNLIDMKKQLKLTIKLSILILNIKMLLITKEIRFINLTDLKKRSIYLTKLSNYNLIMHYFIALEDKI